MQGLQKLQVLDRLRTLDMLVAFEFRFCIFPQCSFAHDPKIQAKRGLPLLFPLHSSLFFPFNFCHTKICVSCSSVTWKESIPTLNALSRMSVPRRRKTGSWSPVPPSQLKHSSNAKDLGAFLQANKLSAYLVICTVSKNITLRIQNEAVTTGAVAKVDAVCLACKCILYSV